MTTITGDQSRLAEVLDAIFSRLPEGGVVILRGDLAAGKTTLVQAAAERLGIDAPVTSPTFALQQCYGERLYHYDVYNKGTAQFMQLGLFEALEHPGYHFIEWGDAQLITLLDAAALPFVVVDIDKAVDSRHYRIHQGADDASS